MSRHRLRRPYSVDQALKLLEVMGEGAAISSSFNKDSSDDTEDDVELLSGSNDSTDMEEQPEEEEEEKDGEVEEDEVCCHSLGWKYKSGIIWSPTHQEMLRFQSKDSNLHLWKSLSIFEPTK